MKTKNPEITPAMSYLWHFLSESYRIAYLICDENEALFSARPADGTLFWEIVKTTGLFSMLKNEFSANGPLVLGTPLGIHFLAAAEDPANGAKGSRRFHILGPFSSQPLDPETIRSSLEQHLYRLPPSGAKEIEERLFAAPVLSPALQDQYALQFYAAVTGKIRNTNEIIYPSYQDSSNKTAEHENINDSDTAVLSDETARAQWLLEQETLRAIREGDPSLLKKQAARNAKSMFTARPFYDKDALRAGKDLLLLYLGSFTAAAIEGGLPPANAYYTEQQFVLTIEECRTLGELSNTGSVCVETFVNDVQKIRAASLYYSAPIIEAREYIRRHIEEDISLEDIAAELHYTMYYFSRKFKEECGCSVRDFIKEEKIARAKELLSHTVMPVSEISERLSFGSLSFFSAMFKEYTGMTPTAWRNHLAYRSIRISTPV